MYFDFRKNDVLFYLYSYPLDATEWEDSDNDQIGDVADLDDDNDGVTDWLDSYPNDASRSENSVEDNSNSGTNSGGTATGNNTTNNATNNNTTADPSGGGIHY
jgi:hypothetical protein